MAIDAAIALAELGVPYTTIIDLCPVMSKSNLNRPHSTCKDAMPFPRSAEAAQYGRLAASPTPENRARSVSHSGALLHSPPTDLKSSLAVNSQEFTAATFRPADCLAVSALQAAVSLGQSADYPVTHDSLRTREPMVERSLSPRDTWLSSHKDRKVWQPGDIAQLDHMRDAEQLHPSGVMLMSSPQQRPACTRLNLKGGLPGLQQSAEALPGTVSVRCAKRRKVIAARLPLLEQELAAQNASAVRDAVPSGRKRDQPDSEMAPFDSPVEDKSPKPSVPCPQSQDMKDQAAAGRNYSFIAAPVHAVSHIKEAERRQMLQRQGLGWLGLVIAGHAHLFRAANREAVREFSAAAALFPNDITSMLSAAVALLAAGDQVGAVSTFQRARVLDPLNVRGMDAYACLLLDQGNHDELRMLSHALFAVDLEMPEVWAVMAYFWLQKGESDKALEYVERYVAVSIIEHRMTTTIWM